MVTPSICLGVAGEAGGGGGLGVDSFGFRLEHPGWTGQVRIPHVPCASHLFHNPCDAYVLGWCDVVHVIPARMLQKVGVLSFSEPYWQDKILELPSRGLDHDEVGRVSTAGGRQCCDAYARDCVPSPQRVVGLSDMGIIERGQAVGIFG